MSKHSDMKYHFIYDMVEKKEVKLRYHSTHEKQGDIFIKGFVKAQFLKLINSLVSPFSIKGNNLECDVD